MSMNALAQACIGMFDSGLGGLSVLREIHNMMPNMPVFYIADQAHVPYGERQLSEIRSYTRSIVNFLLEQGARMIVVACNTASAAALTMLRKEFPRIPFVGMEPAVKPAVQRSRSGIVGVLATPATFQGKMYATLVEKFAQDVKILTNTMPGLVHTIEAGELNSPKARKIIDGAVRPMVAQGADTIVLGCTHFPFVLPHIREAAGNGVTVIDPAPAIARRTAYLLEKGNIRIDAGDSPNLKFGTTGNVGIFRKMIQNLLGISAAPLKLEWKKDLMVITEMRR